MYDNYGGVLMNSNLNLSDRVFFNIRDRIYLGEWKSGEKIDSENKIAAQLGVSRVSVREAIEKFVALNVLSKKKGGGTYVNDLAPSMYLNSLLPMILMNRDNLVDILEFRKIIEVESVRLCSERYNEEDLKELNQIYQDMVIYQNDPEMFHKADFRFHMKIAEATKNSLIIKVNSILTDLLVHHQKEIHDQLGPQGGIDQHVKILNAIKERDSELAVIFMRRHIQRTIDDIIKMGKKGDIHE